MGGCRCGCGYRPRRHWLWMVTLVVVRCCVVVMLCGLSACGVTGEGSAGEGICAEATTDADYQGSLGLLLGMVCCQRS